MKFRVTTNFTVGLSETELSRLKAMLDAGDRGGFYLAYHAMTGSDEALLTGKISTFSEPTGGIAYVSNWLMQQRFQPGGEPPLGGDAPYLGIYALSQRVAQESFKAIRADANGEVYDVKTGQDLKHDGVADGVVSDQRLFNSSFNAWDLAPNKHMFPGNFLIFLEDTVSAANALGGGQADLENPEALPLPEALASPGFKAAAQAVYFAQQLGKREGDFSNVINGPNGVKLAVDSSGRVEGVFDGTDTVDFIALIAPVITQFRAALADLLADVDPIDVLADPVGFVFGQAAFALTEAAGLASFGVTAWPVVRQAWLEAFLEEDRIKAGLLGMSNHATASDAEIAQFLAQVNESDVRSKLSEFSGAAFNGDINPPSGLPNPTLTWKAAATASDDVISLNSGGQLDGLAGDDLLFGAERSLPPLPVNGDDTLIGGAGDDVIWGRSGDDIIYGDDVAGALAGNDTIRGGAGHDYIFGGQGNDFIDGGDVTVSRFFSIFFGSIQVFSDGSDTIDYTKLGNPGSSLPVTISVRINEDIATHFEGETGNLSGSAGVVQKGSSGTLGTDVFHSIERFELGAANNVIRHGTSTKEENKSDGGREHVFNFNLADSTESFTQSIVVAREGNETVSDAVLMVDGKQLVGGAAFDFNKFEMRTGDFGPFSPLLQDRVFGPVETLDVFQAARAASISALFGQASSLAGANPVLPGLGPTGIGIGLSLFFGNLGINEAMRWDTEWLSAYEQVILGWHGERYILSSGPSDQPRRLTIILDAEDTQARQEIVIDNWKQGDFGIRIEEFEPGQGLETGTNKNGIFDQTDLTDAETQAQLAALGFFAPPDPGAGGASPAAPGIVRQGDSNANFLGASDGDDVLRGAEGDDELVGWDGFDTYVFAAGDGHDTIYDASAEGGRIQFLDGVDLAAVTQVEVDDGSGGTNLLITYGNGDTITILGWSSLAQETKDAWVIEGLDGPVISSADPALTPDTSVRPSEQTGTSGDDEIEGSDLAGILDGLAGNDILRGNGGDDQVLGGSGNDSVSGGDGDDRIVAGDGDDIIRGGRGNDDIDGGKGDDIYFFDLGDGADTIRDVDGSFFFYGSTDTNRIIFGEGISAGDIRVERDPDATDALILHIGANGDRIRIVDQYEPAYTGFDGIEDFAFQDGTLWSREDVEELYVATASTDGDDTVVGFEHLDDVIVGGAGNDTLVGSGGSDTYLWNRGDGNDLIVDKTIFNQFDGDIDVLRFGSGIAAADVAVSRPAGGFDLVLTVSGADGGQITVFDFFREFSEPYTNGIEFVQFSDGTTWDKKRLFELSLEGLASDGNDVIAGSPGVDVIDSGLGDDTITGGLEDDTLIGGAGNDVLRGDGGNDTYIFGASTLR